MGLSHYLSSKKKKSGCSLPKGIEHPLALLYNQITKPNQPQKKNIETQFFPFALNIETVQHIEASIGIFALIIIKESTVWEKTKTIVSKISNQTLGFIEAVAHDIAVESAKQAVSIDIFCLTCQK